MRGSYNGKILTDNNGNFYGFNLGADYVAEHELGIRGIHKKFGVDATVNETQTGYDTCVNTKSPTDDIIFKDFVANDTTFSALIVSSFGDIKITKNILQDFQIYPYSPTDKLRCAWDENSFGIVVQKENRMFLKEIYDAIKTNDCVFIIDKGELETNKTNPYEKNFGLCIMINSKIPKDLKDYRTNKDLEKYKIYKAMEETGIEKKLKAAGKHYFALSPKWKDESKKELIFWLNPMNQTQYNYGWMTIQDLLDWTQNKGKVMKN